MITVDDIQKLRLEKRYDEAETILKEYHKHLRQALQADRKPAFRAAAVSIREKGLCIACSKPREPESPSTIRCTKCYQRVVNSKKRLKALRKQNGLCIYCGTKVTKVHKNGEPYAVCQPCIRYTNDSRRIHQWRKENDS